MRMVIGLLGRVEEVGVGACWEVIGAKRRAVGLVGDEVGESGFAGTAVGLSGLLLVCTICKSC